VRRLPGPQICYRAATPRRDNLTTNAKSRSPFMESGLCSFVRMCGANSSRSAWRGRRDRRGRGICRHSGGQGGIIRLQRCTEESMRSARLPGLPGRSQRSQRQAARKERPRWPPCSIRASKRTARRGFIGTSAPVWKCRSLENSPVLSKSKAFFADPQQRIVFRDDLKYSAERPGEHMQSDIITELATAPYRATGRQTQRRSTGLLSARYFRYSRNRGDVIAGLRCS